MSLLQAAPLAGRLSDAVRSDHPAVVGGAAAAWLALSIPWPGRGCGGRRTRTTTRGWSAGRRDVVDPWSLAWVTPGC